MKLTVERNALLNALAHAHGVIERRNTLLILGHILLKTDGQTLSCTATNLEMEALETIPANVQEHGALTAPANLLHDFVRQLHDGAEISLSAEKSSVAHDENDKSDKNDKNNDDKSDDDPTPPPTLVVEAGRARIRFQTLPVSEFPSLANDSEKHDVSFQLPASDLRHLLAKTAFAVPEDDSRYYLNGVFFHADADAKPPKLRAAATDGSRLAQASVNLPDNAQSLKGVIVPKHAVREISRFADDVADDVTVNSSQSRITFVFPNLVFTSKLVDGNFPEYQRYIPHNNPKKLNVDKKRLLHAISVAEVIAREDRHAPLIRVELHPSRISVSAQYSAVGDAFEDVDASYDGEPITFGCYARSLHEIVSKIDDDEVVIALKDPASAIMIHDEGPPRYIIMPTRI